jgi:hypothetical protein
MPSVEIVGRISLLEVIRQTARDYARQPRLILSASAITVLASSVLHLHWLTSSPIAGVLAEVIDLAVVVGFITFVLVAVETPTGRTQGVSGVAEIVRRANAAGVEVALLLLVMSITIAILSGLLEFAAFVVAFTVLLNAATKSHSSLFFDLPLIVTVTAIPALALLTAWSVALPVAVYERLGNILPLGRSYEMVRGNRLRVFAIVALFTILFVLVDRGLRVLVGPVEFEGISLSGAVAGLLLAPVPVLAMSALYTELRGAEGLVEEQTVA